MANAVSRTAGVAIGALLLGLLLGVTFSSFYPEVGVSPELGVLFALIGLALSLIVRACWRRLRPRRHAPAHEA